MDSHLKCNRWVSKNLGGGLIAETFPRRIIVYLDEARKVLVREGRQVGLAGQGPAQAGRWRFRRRPFAKVSGSHRRRFRGREHGGRSGAQTPSRYRR